jgi:hypothetical protein
MERKQLKDGIIYKWENGPLSFDTYVLVESEYLYFCTKDAVRGAMIKADKLTGNETFTFFREICPCAQHEELRENLKPATKEITHLDPEQLTQFEKDLKSIKEWTFK